MVGRTGFEPAAPSPPDWCATKLRYRPRSRAYAMSAGLSLLGGFSAGCDGFTAYAADRFAQRLTRLKRGDAARRNYNCLSGFRIATFAATTFANYETSERNQLHFVAGFERARNLFEHLVDHVADFTFGNFKLTGQ